MNVHLLAGYVRMYALRFVCMYYVRMSCGIENGLKGGE